MNAICSRPEAADGVISGLDIDNFRNCSFVNLWVSKSVDFDKIEMSHLCSGKMRVGPLEPHCQAQWVFNR